MATARDLCDRALRRANVVGLGAEASAEDMAATLFAMNELMYGWAASGVDVLHQGYALASYVNFYIPPAGLDAAAIVGLTYAGTWDASANSPAAMGDCTKVIGSPCEIASARRNCCSAIGPRINPTNTGAMG